MRVYKEIDLRNFEFWGGAVDRVKYLSDEKLDFLDNEISVLCDDCDIKADETWVNDLF